MHYENNNFEPNVYLLEACWISGCFGSAWDGVNFPYSAEFVLGAKRCWSDSSALSSAWRWERAWDTARTSNSSWPKGSPIPNDISSKSWERVGEGEVNPLLCCLSFGAIPMHPEVLQPGKWLDIACWWKEENKFFFSLASLNCLSLDPWGFSHLIFSLSCPAGGSDRAACGDMASNQGHPTTERDLSPYLTLGSALQRQLNDLSLELREPDRSWVYTS